MYYYKVFGYTFRCKYEIKQLYEVPVTDDYDVDIIIGEMPKEITEEVAQTTEFPCIACKNGYFWMNNNYGTLAVYGDGRIYAQNTSDKDVFYLLQYVLGYGIAMYAHLNNRIAIHCGSVVIDDQCVLIAGDSGAGKSTLTDELITDGAILLSDDVVAIGYDENHNPLVYPAFPQQKICRDAAIKKGYNLDDLLYVDPEKDKFAILHTDDYSSEPHKASTFIYLKKYDNTDEANANKNGELIIKKLDGFKKVTVTVNNLYLGCIIPNIGLPAEGFQLCVDLIKDCDVFLVNRPSNRNTLPEIKDFIYGTLKAKADMLTACYIETLRYAATQTLSAGEILNDLSLTSLYEFARLNKLIPLTVGISSALQPSSDKEKQLVQYWKSEAASAVFLEYKKLDLIKRIVALADERGISMTFFKGYLLAKLYPDFAMRNSSDTDILVEPAQLNEVFSMLEELGYYHQSDVDTENVYTYIYNEDGFQVHKLEIHTSLFEDLHGAKLEIFESLKLSSPEKNIYEDFCGISLQTLNYTEHLIYQIFHMVKHIVYHGFPARYLIDTALFIKAYYEQIDWAKMNSVMDSLGYSDFCRQLYSILIKYFDVPQSILCGKDACSAEGFNDLLHDILHFGARSYSDKLSHYFFRFARYIEIREEKSGKLFKEITFDGETVPIRIAPLEYQHNKKLQHRISMLQNLKLI